MARSARFILKRIPLSCSVLACALMLPAGAWGSSVRGTVSAVGRGTFTVQTPGKAVGVVNALAAAATRVTQQNTPYVYGGGHAQAGIASIGMKGPGYNGKRKGYDCSGSVAAVLSAAGLWPTGEGVPNDAGIISELREHGMIAPGAGGGPVEVTLYDDPGMHIFMNIDGRFFGTSDGGGGGDARGGAGWLDDGAPDAFSRSYKRYHVVASALRQSTNAGHSITFQTQDGTSAFASGDKVRVSYRETRAGTLVATAVAYPGEVTTSGVVSSIATDGSSFTLTTANNKTLTLRPADVTGVLQGVSLGDTVQVTYTKGSSGPTVRSLTVTVRAPGAEVTAPSTPATGGSTGPDGSGAGSSPGGAWEGGPAGGGYGDGRRYGGGY